MGLEKKQKEPDYSGYSQDEKPLAKPLTDVEVAKLHIRTKEQREEEERDYSGYSSDEKPLGKPLTDAEVKAYGILTTEEVRRRNRPYDPEEGKLM